MKKLRTKLNLLMMMALMVALLIPVAALAGNDDTASGMESYWNLVGNKTGSDALTRVMNGSSVSISELTQVTADELMAFAAANELPIEMAQYAWYSAMADSLSASGTSAETVNLFLSMSTTWSDTALNSQRSSIRRSLTEADINAMSAQTGLPSGFLAWLMLDDDWYQDEWDDMDDWREGHSTWNFADWVDERDYRALYGTGAVSDDVVERVLRERHRYDDDRYDDDWDDRYDDDRYDDDWDDRYDDDWDDWYDDDDDDWDDRWDDDDDDWDDRWDDDDDDWDDRWDD